MLVAVVAVLLTCAPGALADRTCVSDPLRRDFVCVESVHHADEQSEHDRTAVQEARDPFVVIVTTATFVNVDHDRQVADGKDVDSYDAAGGVHVNFPGHRDDVVFGLGQAELLAPGRAERSTYVLLDVNAEGRPVHLHYRQADSDDATRGHLCVEDSAGGEVPSPFGPAFDPQRVPEQSFGCQAPLPYAARNVPFV